MCNAKGVQVVLSQHEKARIMTMMARPRLHSLGQCAHPPLSRALMLSSCVSVVTVACRTAALFLSTSCIFHPPPRPRPTGTSCRPCVLSRATSRSRHQTTSDISPGASSSPSRAPRSGPYPRPTSQTSPSSAGARLHCGSRIREQCMADVPKYFYKIYPVCAPASYALGVCLDKRAGVW